MYVTACACECASTVGRAIDTHRWLCGVQRGGLKLDGGVQCTVPAALSSNHTHEIRSAGPDTSRRVCDKSPLESRSFVLKGTPTVGTHSYSILKIGHYCISGGWWPCTALARRVGAYEGHDPASPWRYLQAVDRNYSVCPRARSLHPREIRARRAIKPDSRAAYRWLLVFGLTWKVSFSDKCDSSLSTCSRQMAF